MTAPARLLGLRLQGFKSFAERTVVEFGPGISAVVGPNGSSSLATRSSISPSPRRCTRATPTMTKASCRHAAPRS